MLNWAVRQAGIDLIQYHYDGLEAEKVTGRGFASRKSSSSTRQLRFILMKIPQNIYDDPVFFAAYKEFRSSGLGLNDVLEQPALWSMLPDSLAGLHVLDLGCGFGDFARNARKAGARSVLGIDCSERMLARAKELTTDSGIQYRCMSLEQLDVESELFDVIASSLAIHYIFDYRAFVRCVARVMKKRGRFVFSVEHPICTALARQRWICSETGEPLYWPIDDYRCEGPRRTRWFVDDVIKYHRTVETYVNELLQAGFRLRELREPAPVEQALNSNPTFDLHRRRPPFLILSAEM